MSGKSGVHCPPVSGSWVTSCALAPGNEGVEGRLAHGERPCTGDGPPREEVRRGRADGSRAERRPAGGVLRRGHRRRGGHRPRRGGGGGLARLPDRAPRGARLRPGDVEPLDQAGARRRAVPGAGERGAGARGAARAGAAAAQRAAPGGGSRVRRPRLRLVVGPVLRRGAEALRRARRPPPASGRASSSAGRRCWSASPRSSPTSSRAGCATSMGSSTMRGWR